MALLGRGLEHVQKGLCVQCSCVKKRSLPKRTLKWAQAHTLSRALTSPYIVVEGHEMLISHIVIYSFTVGCLGCIMHTSIP